MREFPTYLDAAVLIALVWRSDPEAVLAATDHLNAGFAEYDDWVDACTRLGKLGLLVAGEPLPSPTQAGREIVGRYCLSGTPPRLGAKQLRDALATLPIVADPVRPPDRRVIDDAIAACGQTFRRWQEERTRKALIPNLRDAGILVSLHLGRDSRIDRIAGDDRRPRPTAEDWLHIVEAFGRRGIVEKDGRGLRPSPKGAALVEDCRTKAKDDRDLVHRIVVCADALPITDPEVAIPFFETIESIARGPFWPWLFAEDR